MPVVPLLQPPARRRLRLALVLLCITGLAVVALPRVRRAHADVTSGTVYRDYNSNGVQDPFEFGVGGVTVQAFDATGALLDSTTTSTAAATLGQYSLTVPNSPEIRVEFSGLPSTFLYGPAGPDSGTAVQFVPSNAVDVNVGVNKPSEYCQSNPVLLTSCYVYGSHVGNTEAAIVSFPFDAGTTSTTSNANVANPTSHAIMRPISELGAVWGIAYQRRSQLAFAGAFMKRHADFGPDGTGAIYQIDTANNTASLFLDLNALFGPNTAGPNQHDTADFFNDNGNTGWDAVGKNSLGDVDISEDEQTLWAINLFDRRLYQMPIGYPPVAPTNAQITRITLPDPGTGATGCPFDASTPAGELNRNLRPGALKAANDVIYVGMVCTAESTQQASDLRAFVYAYDPVGGTWTQVVNIPLNYARGCASRNGSVCLSADWRPWSATIDCVRDPNNTANCLHPYGVQEALSQPWPIDIEFDERGAMLLGVADRYGHQTGNNNINTGPVEGVSAGDLLRLAPNGTTWTLESNATSGSLTTSGAGNTQGPGGGEFFFTERHPLATFPTHDEITLGALAVVLGTNQVVNSAFDPPPAEGSAGAGANAYRSGGIIWHDGTSGQRARSYMLYYFDEPLTFGKASGIGDIEPLCQPAPLEIGNRVWFDADQNGRQDPGEFPLEGVTVELYLNGVLVGTAVTDANGNYIFNSLNVPGGIQPGMNYEIRIPLNQGGLTNLVPTNPDYNGSAGDANDSDGVVGGGGAYVSVPVNTGGAGNNDHSYDFGFYPPIPTNVDLVSFTASSALNDVTVRWRTGKEDQTAGFNVYRSLSADRATAVKINATIVPAQGDFSAYSLVDHDIMRGRTYFYWLEEIEVGGAANTYGPAVTDIPVAATQPTFYLPLLYR